MWLGVRWGGGRGVLRDEGTRTIQSANQEPVRLKLLQASSPSALRRERSPKCSTAFDCEKGEGACKGDEGRREKTQDYLSRDILIQRGKSEQAPRSLSSGGSCIQSHAKRRE